MIGFFLVFVSLVCAVCRGWMRRLKDVIYERRIGQILFVETDDEEPRMLYFVQFFVRGTEYWGWKEVDRMSAGFQEQLLGLEPVDRPHKIDSAFLVEGIRFEELRFEGVTQLLRELSGPDRNFYGEGTAVLTPGFLKAYLEARGVDVLRPWDYCELRVVPGSMPPFLPLRIPYKH